MGVSVSIFVFIIPYFYRPQSLGQGNIFTPFCHSVHRGGVPDHIPPPGRYTPWDQVHPQDQVPPQVHPGQVGTGRYTPQTWQVHPPGTRQVHLPGPGRYTPPPGTRQVHPQDQAGTPPWDQVHPLSRTRYPPGPGRYTPWTRQIHPQTRQVPPRDQAGTPPGPGTHPPPGRYPPPLGKQIPAYGKRAGGTHPTGMHSCYLK